jgi:hypothetical protein
MALGDGWKRAYIKADAPKEACEMTQAKKQLPPEALRALAEAEERRKNAGAQDLPKELGGRKGLDPARYGDWEKKGIAVDF